MLLEFLNFIKIFFSFWMIFFGMRMLILPKKIKRAEEDFNGQKKLVKIAEFEARQGNTAILQIRSTELQKAVKEVEIKKRNLLSANFFLAGFSILLAAIEVLLTVSWFWQKHSGCH